MHLARNAALIAVLLASRSLSSQEAALADEPASAMGRNELVAFQGAHGLLLATEACAAAGCDEPVTIGVGLLGGTSALGLALWLAPDNVSPGQAMAANFGVIWGAWNGLWINTAQRRDGLSEGIMAACQLGGLGLGTALAVFARPSSGDAAFANLLTTWGTVIAGYGSWAVYDQIDRHDIPWMLLAAMDTGLVAGWALTSEVEISRLRALLIHAGGLAGTLAGLGAGVFLVEQDAFTRHELPLVMTTTTALGLIVAIASTANFD